MVGTVERDDRRLPSNEERRSERDLDGVLAGHGEHDLPPTELLAETAAKRRRDIGLRQVPERVDAALGLRRDRLYDC